MQYLLDTTWAVEYLRGRPAFVVAVDERRARGLALSFVTLAELFSGVARSTDAKAEKMLRRFLRGVRLVGVDEGICRIWGEEDARLSRGGERIGDLDLFVAATALARDLTVCTQNRKHFERVRNLKIESVEVPRGK